MKFQNSVLPLLILLSSACTTHQETSTVPDTGRSPAPVVSSKPDAAYPEWEAEVTGASIVIEENIHTIHAVPVGTSPLPEGAVPLLKAVDQALALNREGKDARIKLASGEYRKNLFIRKDRGVPASKGLLVIEGPEDRSAIVTSSSNWSDAGRWTVDPETPSLISTMWEKEWGDMDITHPEKRVGDSSPWIKMRSLDDVRLQLTWKPAQDTGEATTFRLYRQSERRDRSKRYQGKDEKTLSDWEVVYEGQKRTFTDSGLVKSKTWDATQYRYRVVEVQEGAESEVSNVVQAAPGDSSNAARPNELGRRRELAFVDGVLLQQVLTSEELTPGSYYVDDGYPGNPNDGRITLMLPEGAALGQSRIDVTTNQWGKWTGAPQWLFDSKENLVIRNITVQHHPGHYHSAAALVVRNCRNVLVENCTFTWNNGAGLGVRNTSDLTWRNLEGSDNGGCGLMWAAGGNILAEDLITNRNNWRGHWGNIYSWAYAGIKGGFGTRGMVVHNHQAYDNWAHGLWFDYNVKNLVVDGLDARRNHGWGTFIEAMHGPTILRNSKLIENRQGIHLANSAKVALHNNLSMNNTEQQLCIIRRLNRPVSDQDLNPDRDAPVPSASGSTINVPVNVIDSTWTDNVFVSDIPEAPLLDTFGYRPFFETLDASRNLYWHVDPENAFKTELISYNFHAWQKLTGQDLDSQFGDPKLNDHLEPGGDSPLRTRGDWELTSIEDPGFHQMSAILLENAKRMNQRSFASAEGASEERWVPINFSSTLNMPMSGAKELANPLPMLKAGPKPLRGIPFEIGEVEGWGASAISLKSTKQPVSPKGELPQTVTVPVAEGNLERVYVLHVASHAIGHLDIAYYSLLFEDGTRHQVGIIPLGKGSDDGPTLEKMEAKANCQDWWPSWPHFEKEMVKPVMILDPENPTNSLRYLYILEIPNPTPEKNISALEFKVRWPQGPATFNILAATGLKP